MPGPITILVLMNLVVAAFGLCRSAGWL